MYECVCMYIYIYIYIYICMYGYMYVHVYHAHFLFPYNLYYSSKFNNNFIRLGWVSYHFLVSSYLLQLMKVIKCCNINIL